MTTESSFSTHSYQQFLQQTLQQDRKKDQHAPILARFQRLEEELIQKTVLIQGVPAKRQRQLQDFLYRKGGVVEECVPCQGGFRVRFKSASVSEWFPQHGKDGLHPCDFATNGQMHVQAYSPQRYGPLILDALQNPVMKLPCTHMASGFWCPASLDSYCTWKGESNKNDSDIFLQDKVIGKEIELQIDLKERKIVLEYAASRAEWRFKEVELVDVVQYQRQYSVILVTKHAPQVYQGKNRSFHWPLRGCCCTRVRLSESRLLQERWSDLVESGLVSPKIEKLQDARTLKICTVRHRNVEATIEAVHAKHAEMGACMVCPGKKPHTDSGLLFRAILDRNICCGYDLLHDQDARGLDIFTCCQELDPRVTCQILSKLLEDCLRTRYPSKLFCALRDTEGNKMKTIPEACVNLPRVTLTPSRTIVQSFQIEVGNRLVRQLLDEGCFEPTNLLRLKICDEDEQRIYSNHLNNELVARVRAVLTEGLHVNGVCYRFLAYSSSQLRELSVWMVHLPDQWSVRRIRGSLGNLAGLTAPKFAARMGLCLSTTLKTLKDEEDEDETRKVVSGSEIMHTVIDEIVSLNNGENYIHSDGTGIVRPEIMEELLKYVPYAIPSEVSIIQIRYGGAKGTMTVYDPAQVPHLQAKDPADVYLRPSMIKFDAPYRFLEVCRVGTAVPYYLNRSVIMLLCARGVDRSVFLTLQKGVLEKVDSMMYKSVTAKEMVRVMGGIDTRQRNMLSAVLTSGAKPARDPFLFSCLLAMRSHDLFDMRKKARILVDKGVVLLGGIDETGELEEGCIFLQIDQSPPLGHYQPLQGRVLVTKHPVMHPGDTRMLLAVDVSALRHLRNVVIFSQHGSRPEADKMAGSDLDGDEFAISWDERLFFDENFPPQCYKAPKQSFRTVPVHDTVEQDHALIDHLIDFARKDSLGFISMLWQDHAAEKGADCPECLELAKLHSIAVDFPKSGVPSSVPAHLKWGDKPYAHWRERKRKESFHCSSIIGRLYDEVIGKDQQSYREKCKKAICGRRINKHGQVLAVAKSDAKSRKLSPLKLVYDADLVNKLGLVSTNSDAQPILDLARRHSKTYQAEVTSLMCKYRLRNEGELFTGCIRKLEGSNKKRQSEAATDVQRHCRYLTNVHREVFFRNVMQLANVQDVSEESLAYVEALSTRHASSARDAPEYIIPITARKLAAAYYHVTYSPLSDKKTALLFSFPWIVADVVQAGVMQADQESG